MIDKIIDRALELERTAMSSSEEPEIGINEGTNMITINRYSEITGTSIWIEDFCDVIDIDDMEKLKNRLAKNDIAYCL